MINQKNTTILIVPGLRDHVEEHWQTLLAARLTKVKTVAPLEQDKLSLEARVNAIQKAIEEIDGPIIVVAHSEGTVMMAHWAERFGSSQVQGVLFAVPPDLEKPMHAPHPSLEQIRAHGWLPVPRRPLPFHSIVCASSNDPLADIDVVIEMARDWNSELVLLGRVGHLNPASGYGNWPQADSLVQQLIDAV